LSSNIIQWIWDKISKINANQRRDILVADLDAVLDSQDFYDYFSDLIWGKPKRFPASS